MAKRRFLGEFQRFILTISRPVANERGLASAFIVVFLSALFFSTHERKRSHFGESFKMTFYWTIEKPTTDIIGDLIPVKGVSGEVLGWGPEPLIREISIEGSGYLPNGLLINLACNCPYPDSRFIVVDSSENPWGLDARANPLIPFQSIAVDPSIIRLGEKVFIPVFQGLNLPDGTEHTGCFDAVDVGHGVGGRHIDIFAGTIDNYLYAINALSGLTVTRVYSGKGRC